MTFPKIPNIAQIAKRISVEAWSLTRKGIEIQYTFDGEEKEPIILNKEESAECLKDHNFIEDFFLEDGILMVICEDVWDTSDERGEHVQHVNKDAVEWHHYALCRYLNMDEAMKIAVFKEWGNVIDGLIDITEPVSKITSL